MTELIRELHELANQVAKFSPHLAMVIHKKANEIEDELMFNWEEREIRKWLEKKCLKS